jgi:hypothetical protein
MPNRGSQNVHDNDYKWLVELYGEKCLLNKEHMPPAGQRLQVDHISDDPAVYDLPSNKSLVCAGCNSFLRGIDARDEHRPYEHRLIIEHARAVRSKELTGEKERSAQQNRGGQTEAERLAKQLKRARKKSGIDTPLPDFSRRQIIEYMNGSSEMKANQQYLPDFCLWVWSELIKKGPLPEKDKYNDDILNSGSADISGHPSQLTLQRYLDWLCKKSLSRTDNGGRIMIYFRNPAKASRVGKGEK